MSAATRKRRGSRRGLWIAAALAAAAGAAWWSGLLATGPEPLDDIDPRSRERLEEVLREAEREPGP